MELFENVFNKVSIYDMLFFNIKAVLEYPTLKELEENNNVLYECWKEISKDKYNGDFNVRRFSGSTDESEQYLNDIYQKYAINYPEFCKIVTITYATAYNDKGDLKRYLKKISNNNECDIIVTFIDLLRQLSTDASQSTPTYFPIFCGYNIINFDIPLLIKRFLSYRNDLNGNNKEIPLILKKCLSSKPWESSIIDVINVWKFNGNNAGNTSLNLISNFLGLKKTTELVSNNEISDYYWNNVNEKPEETLEFIGLQSATQTNLVIQLINELRLL